MSTNHVPPRSAAANEVSNAQLLEMQRQKRKKSKRKVVIIVISIILAVFIIGAILIGIAINKINSLLNEQFNNVVNTTVTVGSFGSSVSGTGEISAVDTDDIDIRNTLTVLDVFVAEGDSVNEGDLIATVSNSSLMGAISGVQGQIDALDVKIANAEGDKVAEKVKAPVNGRVKKIYCEKNVNVSDTMYENNALMLLSIDGYMAVDIESDSLKNDDKVTVIASNGKEYEGTVEKCIKGTATILVSDKETVFGDKVTVKSGAKNIGEGELYIHNQLAITGYTGTVKSVNVNLNSKVKAGDTVIRLKNRSTSADYDALLKQRKSLEEDLNELLKIYKEGGIRATSSGVIDMIIDPDASSSDDNSDYSDSNYDYSNYGGYDTGADTENQPEEGYQRIAQISPNSEMSIIFNVKESDIIKLQVGQKAHIKIESISYECDGIIDKIDNKANSANGLTTYKATIKFDKTPEMLSGMTADIDIKIDGADNVLMLPVNAVHQSGTGYYVYTSYDTNTNSYSGMVNVEVGLFGDEYVEIVSGINEGATVYYQDDSNSFFEDEETIAVEEVAEHNEKIDAIESDIATNEAAVN